MEKSSKTEENIAVGRKIRAARKAKDLTLEKLGKAMSISTVTACRYETGERQPKYDYLVRLAKFLDVSVSYLLGAPEKQVLDVTGLSDKEIEVFRSLVKIVKEGKNEKWQEASEKEEKTHGN